MSGIRIDYVLKQKPVILISFAFFLFYLFYAFKLNVWEDEVHTLATISGTNLKDLLKASVEFEGQPPFYFIIAFLWGKISSTVLFMRLLSSIFTITTGLIIYNIYKKKSPDANWWVLILVFSNPYMLYLATEIRCYSLVVLLSVLILYLFSNYYFSQYVSYKIRVIYIILSILAVNTQYFIAFLLFANWVFLFWKGYKRVFLTYLVDMVFVMISLLWVPFFLFNQVDQHLFDQISCNLRDYFSFIFGRLDGYFLFRDYFPFKIVGYIIEITILITIGISIYRNNNISKYFSDNLYFIYLITVMSAFFLVLYPVLGKDLLAIRHTAILFPLVLILFLKTFNYFQNRIIKAILILTIFGFYLSGTLYYYKSFIKDVNIQGYMNYLSDNIKEDEPIVIFKHRIAVPFTFHFIGENKINVFPYPIDYSVKWDAKALAEPAKKEAVEKLLTKISENSSFWVVNFYYPGSVDPDVQVVDSLIGKEYILEADTEFVDTKRYSTYFPVQIRKLKRH